MILGRGGWIKDLDLGHGEFKTVQAAKLRNRYDFLTDVHCFFPPYLDFLWEIDTTDPISIGDNQHFQGVNQSFCGKIIGYNPIHKYTFLHIVYPTIGWDRRHTLQLDNKLPYLEDLRNCNCLALLS